VETRRAALCGGGSSVMRCSNVRVLFIGLALLVVLMIVWLQARMGHGTLMAIHDALFDTMSDSHEPHQHDVLINENERRRSDLKGIEDNDAPVDQISGKHQGGEPQGGEAHQHVKGHDHNKQVSFVFHESVLGAPEFIGRNQKSPAFMDGGGFDDPNTLLNQPDLAYDETAFNVGGDNAKDRRIAIGCALTTRQQNDLNKENLAAELPFFKVSK